MEILIFSMILASRQAQFPFIQANFTSLKHSFLTAASIMKRVYSALIPGVLINNAKVMPTRPAKAF